MLLLLVACMGFDEETNLQELRVLAMQSEPPELRMSDFMQATSVISVAQRPLPIDMTPEQDSLPPMHNIIIVDPENTGYRVAVWQCTNLGEGCLEKDIFADTPEQWISLYTDSDVQNNVLSIPITLNPLWLQVLPPTEDIFPITSLFALACVEGTCPMVDDAFQGTWDLNIFAQPFDMLKDVSIQNSSLAFQQLYLSTRSTEERLQNPIMSVPEENWTMQQGGSFSIPTHVEVFQRNADTASVYGYATLGGFSSNSLVNNALYAMESDIELSWFTPEDVAVGVGSAFIIANDGLGGVSWVQKQIEVTPLE